MDLRKFPLFANLPEEELKIANGLLRVKEFARREIVCRKQEAADGLYLLFSGQLQAIDIAEDGREIGLNLIKPGAFFGELSVIDGLPRSAHIVALVPSVLHMTSPELSSMFMPQSAVAGTLPTTGVGTPAAQSQPTVLPIRRKLPFSLNSATFCGAAAASWSWAPIQRAGKSPIVGNRNLLNLLLNIRASSGMVGNVRFHYVFM